MRIILLTVMIQAKEFNSHLNKLCRSACFYSAKWYNMTDGRLMDNSAKTLRI